MDAFNPIPSPAKTPGSVDNLMDISSNPSTPLQAPLSVSSMPGTPLLFSSSTIGGPASNAPPTPGPPPSTPSSTPNVNLTTATTTGGIATRIIEGMEVKVELPSSFQYQASPQGASGGATPQHHHFVGGATPTSATSYSVVTSEPQSSRESPDTSGFALSDLLMQLEDYTPTIPDSVANHYLHQAGFETVDPRMSRLLSLAAQKFISDVVNEAFTHCKLKGQANNHPAKTKVKDKKYTLTMEDLVPVLNEHGITVRKPPYYT